MVAARANGRRIEAADAWIAATALLYDAAPDTHNPRDYLGVTWWSSVALESSPLLYLTAAWATPACSLRASALSVASQLKVLSVRPKWPKAAVLR